MNANYQFSINKIIFRIVEAKRKDPKYVTVSKKKIIKETGEAPRT